MRSSAELITAVRLLSRNVANQDGTYTITDGEILQYLNDAQDRLQNLISSTKNIAKIFVTEQILSIVAAQEGYSIPDRVLLNKQIEAVDYSATGNIGDYIRLEKLNMVNRDTNNTMYPHGYIKRGNQILLQPTPSVSTGSIRVSYERELDDMALAIDTVSGTPSGTSIVVATGSTSYTSGVYLSIVHPNGTVLLRNGLISSYNSGSKTITLSANVSTYLVGTTTLADLASMSLVLGRYTTTYSQLPDNCERYLIHYSVAEVYHKDSSNDYSTQQGILADIESDILKSLSSQTGEIQFIPQINRYEWW